MRFRTLAIAVAVMLSSIALTLIPVSAEAAQGTRPCRSHAFCFYENGDYNKIPDAAHPNPWSIFYKKRTLGNFDNPPDYPGIKARDQLSSVINNTSKRICVYNVIGKRHYLLFVVRPYQDMTSLPSGTNDKADYWRATTKSKCP